MGSIEEQRKNSERLVSDYWSGYLTGFQQDSRGSIGSPDHSASYGFGVLAGRMARDQYKEWYLRWLEQGLK